MKINSIQLTSEEAERTFLNYLNNGWIYRPERMQMSVMSPHYLCCAVSPNNNQWNSLKIQGVLSSGLEFGNWQQIEALQAHEFMESYRQYNSSGEYFKNQEQLLLWR